MIACRLFSKSCILLHSAYNVSAIVPQHKGATGTVLGHMSSRYEGGFHTVVAWKVTSLQTLVVDGKQIRSPVIL